LLSQSGLAQDLLGQVYTLADADRDGKLSLNEFLVAMKLVRAKLDNHPIPGSVPPELLQSLVNKPSQSLPQSSTQLFEQRISDLQSRINSNDNEIADLKIRLQTALGEKERAMAMKNEFESRAIQAEARVNALGNKSQEETSQALQKINELSNQLSQSFSKIEALNSQNSSLEIKLQQANSQWQSSQSQLQNAQHQISVNAFSPPQSHASSPWGVPSDTPTSAFGGSALPPPITSPSHSSTYSAFGSTSTPLSPFGTPSTAQSNTPFGTPAPSNASSQPQNPFLMGMNF